MGLGRALVGLVPIAISGSVAAAALASNSLPACAERPTKVGEFAASGIVFRDIVEVHAFADPKIEGITIHVSNVKRSVAERLKRDFFTDPSQASVSASQTGPLRLLAPIAMGPEGEEVFSAKRNLFFKTTHVRRIYDELNNALVYVAYSTRLTQVPDRLPAWALLTKYAGYGGAKQQVLRGPYMHAKTTATCCRYRTSVSSIGLHGQKLQLKQQELE